MAPATSQPVSNGDVSNGDTVTTTTTKVAAEMPKLTTDESEAAIERFCEFLRFETVSRTAPHTGAYKACAEWLLERLKEIPAFASSSSAFLLEEAPDHSPVVVACWKGVDESLPVLLLNSHYDVVPAPADDWSKPPFAGLRQDGIIWGRGCQDMKSVCMQYVEAIRKIVTDTPDWKPARSIYLTFVPDEEIGGAGMAAFLDSKTYKSLPGIALALDEGLASTSETLSVFYGERIPWFIQVTATGPTGHGSRFIENTAVEQLLELCDKALKFRTGQRELLGLKHDQNCAHAVAAKNNANKLVKVVSPVQDLGEVTSLNITSLEAGVKSGGEYAYNCVPPKAQCSLDIRISPHTDPNEIEQMLNTWCQECSKGGTGGGQDGDSKSSSTLSWSYIGRGHDGHEHHLTSTEREVNPWYAAFSDALSNLGLSIEPQVFPAASDSRFLRALGIRALGFSPMRSTTQTPCEVLLHEVNEHIPEATFLEGISIYIHLIRQLASQGKEVA